MERCGRLIKALPQGSKHTPMKTCRLLAASFAATTLCVASTAFAEDPPSASGDYVYDGKMPPISQRMKGKIPRENTHMTLVGADHYGRKPVIASVDEGKNAQKQIKVVFNP